MANKRVFTNEEIIKRFETELDRTDLSSKSVKSYMRVVRSLLTFVGKDVKDIDFYDCEDFINDYCTYNQAMLAKGVKQKNTVNTINQRTSVINKFFEYCRTREFNERDIYFKVSSDKEKAKRDEKKVRISIEYFHRIIEANDDYFKSSNVTFTSTKKRAIIYMLMYTGLRKSELLNLQMDDVGLIVSNGEKVLKVHANGKGRKLRDIYAPYFVYSVLNDWLIERKIKGIESEYLFVTHNGERMGATFVDNLCRTASEIANIKENDESVRFSPHDFRHAFGSYLHNENVPMAQISKLMGHANTTITEKIYVHADADRLMGATSVFKTPKGFRNEEEETEQESNSIAQGA